MQSAPSFTSLGKSLSRGGMPASQGDAMQVSGDASTLAQSSSSSSSSVAHGEFAGRQVRRLERKSSSDRIEEPGTTPTPRASSVQPSVVGVQSAFQRMSRHFKCLASTFGVAVTDAGSAKKVNQQAAHALVVCTPCAFDAQAFGGFCQELQAIEGIESGVVALLAGAFAAQAGVARQGAQECGSYIDALVKCAILARTPEGAARAVDMLFAVAEAMTPNAPFINGAFLRLVVPRLLGASASPQPLRMFEQVAGVCLGVATPAALACCLRLALEGAKVTGEQRAQRLCALVQGLAQAQPPASDRHLRVLLRFVLRDGQPAADLPVFAGAIAQTPLWERYGGPGLLEPHELGRLLLASASRSLQADGKATVVMLDDEEGGVETKAGPVRRQASASDPAALVRALPLSTHKGAEGRLAREILAIHRALDGHADAPVAREALRQRILDAAPHAHHLSLVAMACGWGIAEGVASADKAQFKAICAQLRVPSLPAAWAGVANDAFALGLRAAQNIDQVGADGTRHPEGRIAVAQVHAEALGPLGERQLTERLQQIPGLELAPLVAAGWLDALVIHGFQGSDFDPLRTVRLMMTAYAQSIAGPATPTGQEPAERVRGLRLIADFVGRMHALVHNRMAQRYDQGLWVTDASERESLLALARATQAFLQEEVDHYTGDEPPQALRLAVTEQLLGFEESVRAGIERMTERKPDPRYAQEF